MENENKSFGTAVIGHGTQFEKEVPIKSFCRVTFTDHRLCTTFKMEYELPAEFGHYEFLQPSNG